VTKNDYDNAQENDILLLELGEQTVTHVDGSTTIEPFWVCTLKRFFEEIKFASNVQDTYKTITE